MRMASSADRVDSISVDLLVDELQRDGCPLVVLRRESSIDALVPLLWPILEWCPQSPVWITDKPMLDDLLPGLTLRASRAIWMSDWHLGNHKTRGREGL